jgi:hypothetical protein
MRVGSPTITSSRQACCRALSPFPVSVGCCRTRFLTSRVGGELDGGSSQAPARAPTPPAPQALDDEPRQARPDREQQERERGECRAGGEPPRREAVERRPDGARRDEPAGRGRGPSHQLVTPPHRPRARKAPPRRCRDRAGPREKSRTRLGWARPGRWRGSDGGAWPAGAGAPRPVARGPIPARLGGPVRGHPRAVDDQPAAERDREPERQPRVGTGDHLADEQAAEEAEADERRRPPGGQGDVTRRSRGGWRGHLANSRTASCRTSVDR